MANDSWRTPPEVFGALNKEFNFIADMASTKENALCKTFFTEEDDSLSFNWLGKLASIGGINSYNQYVWLNCPYSNPMPWIKKAIEAQSDGLGVVMLLNADHSVGWFAKALPYVSEIRNVIADKSDGKREYASGRIAFIDGEGKSVAQNNKPQFILVFNPFKIGSSVTSYVTKRTLYELSS